ncbi:MAG: galactokinase [Candidatus Limnocylindrales bacterium]
MSEESIESNATGARAANLRARLAAIAAADAAAPDAVESPIRLVRAPGRVNLIGEYTDVNEGWVLPAAIDREVWIAFQPWDRAEVQLTSVELGETLSFSFDALSPEHVGARPWIDYIAGTAWAMREAGLPIRGFRGLLNSTIPVGSGLSSSAAVEMAATWALADPRAPRPAPSAMALIAQRAENAYMGVQCGIMDQFASAAGRSGQALLIDCRRTEASPVPIPAGLSLVVCDTKARRDRLDASAYNTRRAECELGAELIAEREPGVRTLRDVDEAMFERHRHLLPENVARRCEHIVREDGRVQATVAALTSGDLAALGRLFAASHASLRDLFEVSCMELDTMVDIATAVPGVVASRMTGAGFGGCTVSLVRKGAEGALVERVLGDYPARTGITPEVYVVSATDGAGVVTEASGQDR